MTKPIGSDFIPLPAPRKLYCSECSKVIAKGEIALVSIKDGKVRKRVCSEECRLEFDARFWQHAARVNARRRASSLAKLAETEKKDLEKFLKQTFG